MSALDLENQLVVFDYVATFRDNNGIGSSSLWVVNNLVWYLGKSSKTFIMSKAKGISLYTPHPEGHDMTKLLPLNEA